MTLKTGDVRRFCINYSGEIVEMLGVYSEVPFTTVFLVDGNMLDSRVKTYKVVNFKIPRLDKVQRAYLEELSNSLKTYEKLYKKVQKERTPSGECESAWGSVLNTHLKVAKLFNTKNSKVAQKNIDIMVDDILDYINEGEIYTYESLAKKILKDKVTPLEELGFKNISVYSTNLEDSGYKYHLFFTVTLSCECDKSDKFNDTFDWVETIEDDTRFYVGDAEGGISFELIRYTKTGYYLHCELIKSLSKEFLSLSEDKRIETIKSFLNRFDIRVSD